MSKITKNYRFNYDELKQKFHFEDPKVPFHVRDLLDNVVLTSLFYLRSFHVLQMHFVDADIRIVHHYEGKYQFDCFVS